MTLKSEAIGEFSVLGSPAALFFDRPGFYTASQRLTAVLEPLLILCLVVLVGFIGVATILPLLEAADVF